jgi:hypothetical protein
MKKFSKSLSGFSLVELSIITLILSVIIVGLVRNVESDEPLDKKIRTNEKLERIKEATYNYAREYGHYPCPADPVKNISTIDFGVGSRDVDGACATDNLIWDGRDLLLMGDVPFADLGLPVDYLYDEFGNKISYLVVRKYADKPRFMTDIDETPFICGHPKNYLANYISDLDASPYDYSLAAPSSRGNSNPDPYIRFAILKNYQANLSGTYSESRFNNWATTANVESEVAEFALISFGKDGYGANTSEGFPINSGSTRKQLPSLSNIGDSEQAWNNHHLYTSQNNSADKIDNIIIDSKTSFDTPSSTPVSEVRKVDFDDIVVYGYGRRNETPLSDYARTVTPLSSINVSSTINPGFQTYIKCMELWFDAMDYNGDFAADNAVAIGITDNTTVTALKTIVNKAGTGPANGVPSSVIYRNQNLGFSAVSPIYGNWNFNSVNRAFLRFGGNNSGANTNYETAGTNTSNISTELTQDYTTFTIVMALKWSYPYSSTTPRANDARSILTIPNGPAIYTDFGDSRCTSGSSCDPYTGGQNRLRLDYTNINGERVSFALFGRNTSTVIANQGQDNFIPFASGYGDFNTHEKTLDDLFDGSNPIILTVSVGEMGEWEDVFAEVRTCTNSLDCRSIQRYVYNNYMYNYYIPSLSNMKNYYSHIAGQNIQNANATYIGKPYQAGPSDITGINAGAGTLNGFSGDIGEVMIFNRKLTPYEINLINCYMVKKWIYSSYSSAGLNCS